MEKSSIIMNVKIRINNERNDCMSLRYTMFKDAGNNKKQTIAIRGLSEKETVTAIGNGVVKITEDQVYVFDKEAPNGLRGEQLIVNEQLIDPCTTCTHRVRNITTGCTTCQFETTDEKMQIAETAPIYLLAYLQEKEAEKVSSRAAYSTDLSPFEKNIYPSDICLDDETVEHNQKELAIRSQKAAATRKFKEEHCATCVYSDEKNKCNHTHPTYCRTHNYRSEAQMMERILGTIQDRDRLLQLSKLCGNTVKYRGVRHRVSYVKNEMTNQFVLTRDYAPWDTSVVTLDELIAIEPYWKESVESQTFLENISEEDKNKHAVTLAILRRNWDNISRIERWQRQHMFWATFNPYSNQVDIAIHLSKDHYCYSFKNPVELVQKTTRIYF